MLFVVSDSRDMDKNISSAALRLNAFLRIEPLHRTARLLISMQKIYGTHANSACQCWKRHITLCVIGNA